ncbi:MAG: PIN domain-containing protein [Fibromonadaceae bacterium]|jgi:predicted nucleic acid-binding protein|nr:PIN domain-containing protein [Fibromonadaceae bacterium]
MVVLIDTNVLIDFLQNREVNGEYANKIIEMCAKKAISGFMAAHSISNSFYILRKDYSVKERKEMLLGLCNIIDIVDIDKQKVITSLLNEDFSDFEDCLQMECAKRINADYIITRDLPDFFNSSIKAILPMDFVKQFNGQ